MIIEKNLLRRSPENIDKEADNLGMFSNSAERFVIVLLYFYGYEKMTARLSDLDDSTMEVVRLLSYYVLGEMRS